MFLIGSAVYYNHGSLSPEMLWGSLSRVETPSPFADRSEYKDLMELQAAFIRNAKTIKPHVVSINNVKERTLKSSWYDVHAPAFPWYYRLKEWIVDTVGRKRYVVDSVGSGINLDSEGHILTNNHVIQNSDKIMVKFSDGHEYFAEILGSDPKSDLAVLKISTFRRMPVPSFGDSQKVNVGAWVMAVGNPFGLEGTVTVGVVSGKSRNDVGITTYEDFIQTDASINPGNSGGPLIDLQGRIIGINTAVAELGSGVGFAIPIEMALAISRELIQRGSVERGWLGVGIQSLTPELAHSFNLPPGIRGVLVNSVESKTPAEEGGILRGDIIVLYDGGIVTDSRGFQMMVAKTKVGKEILIRILREGQEKDLRVIIGRMYF